VRELLARLGSAGARVWLVGGTVRDLLLGLQPRDFDLATDLPPRAVAGVLPEADLQDERFGACRVPGLPWPVVVTTLRAESGYADHRRPTEVHWIDDPARDAVRRDFSVNALYAEAGTGAIVDPTGGLADLRQRCLRVLGDAERRLGEDPLRLLRLLRFEAQLGFEPDPAAVAAARAVAGELRHLSPERAFAELTRTFTGPRRGHALRRFVDLGFAAVLLPEVAAMDGVPQPPQYHPEGDVLTHVGLVLDHVPDGDETLSWAALLHDVGKPPTFRRAEDRIRFDGHDTLSASMADAVLRRLHAPTALRAAVVEVCRDHIRIASLPRMRPRRRERWMRDPLFPTHLAFHRADCLGSHGDLSLYETAAAALAALPPARAPLVTGADALALGVAEGPRIGRLLAAVDEELDARGDPAPTREHALALLQRLVAADVKPWA
jgi:poly(A) polymerase